MTLDYKGLEALHNVIQQQSFEQAAEKLHISQPSISQRLRHIEKQYETPLLICSHPYRPMPLGERLLAHFQKVKTLEI